MAKVKTRPRNDNPVAAAPVEAAPEPEPQPTPAQPAAPLQQAQPAQAVATTDDSLGDLASLVTGNNELTTLSEGFEPTSETANAGDATPYVGFFANNAKASDDIREKLGKPTAGTPYISAGASNYHPFMGLEMLLMNSWPYWAEVLDDGTMTQASLKDPRDRDSVLKKNILAPLLVLPGVNVLPEELGLAFITLTNFRSTKCKIPEQHNAAMLRATEAGWAAKHGTLGGAVMQWPAYLRVASSIRLAPKTSKKKGKGYGKAYQQGSAAPHCLTADQIRAIAWWLGDDDCKEEAAVINAAYRRKIEEITALALVTADAPAPAND